MVGGWWAGMLRRSMSLAARRRPPNERPRLRGGGGAGGTGALYRDETERERAVRYNRAREWLTLAGLAWGGATALLALTTGFSARLRDRAARVAPCRLGPPVPYTLAAA